MCGQIQCSLLNVINRSVIVKMVSDSTLHHLNFEIFSQNSYLVLQDKYNP